MGEVGRAGDDKIFRVNFAGDGTARLREKVKEKLKEFMGDYTDDTLVEYVIVLIRNGRQKDEAKKELNVFLGDDSDSFVSWLWDHLSLNMDLYAQPKESLTEEVADRIVTTDDHFDKSNIEMSQANFGSHTDFEQQGENFGVNVSRSRRNREWKDVGAMTGSFPLRSTVIEALYPAEKTNERVDVRHLSPPRPQASRKRNREDGWPPKKRDTELLPKLGPSRRLLEFAVRDAVKTVQQSSSKSEPALKRLCSVVSSSADSLLDKRPQRPRSTVRMPGSASVALKAAAEAAEDVRKSKNEGSVFNRLGRGKAIQPTIDQSYNIRTPILQDATIKEYDQSARSYQVDYNQKDDYSEDFTGNSLILDRVDDMEVDSASDNDGYDDFGLSTDHDLEASQCAYSVNKKENSLMLHYNVSKDTDALIKKMKVPQEPPPAASTNPSSKIVNISVNVNTWKPPEYQVSRNVNEVDHQIGDSIERTTVKPNVHILKESPSSITGTDKEMISADIHKEIQKPQASTPGVSYTTSRPSENVESRTIYISNVHFGATKDNLSRHFNKFGEVLKVMIVTDPATGQPIGSAYVEFLRKESAELALSLNGTSFMSRILKVIRRSSVEPHATGWSRIARASHFTSRLGRMPFPRGILPGAFRARFPVKPGARSLQWKRGSPSQTTDGSRSAPLTPRSNTGRNLTYVRPEKT